MTPVSTEISLLTAFGAGLVSFLSPCVLPLVPGYISMLSGIGVEQLRQGEQPKNGLLNSALAFVVGFSVVFIGFGASASAVGGFLQQHKSLMTPIAGALILLFGLHLLGGLIRMNVWAGIVLGGVLVALGIASLMHHGPLFAGLGAVHFFFAVDHRVFRSGAGPLAKSGRSDSQYRHETARDRQRILAGICVRIRLDSMHWAGPFRSAGSGRRERNHRTRGIASGGVLGRIGRAVSPDRAGARSIFAFLPEFPAASPRRGTVQRSSAAVYRRPGLLEQTNLALGQTHIFESFFYVDLHVDLSAGE